MNTESSNSKRLAKNTVLMYFRMIFLMLISLYTARIVLEKLGVEDYGTYNVVGSIVALFSSLRSLFAASTQRFLNYEMGQGNSRKLQLIFNLSTVLNGGISIVFLILAEIVGLWFINNEMIVDPGRLHAVHFVFQLSVITTVITIMNVPLDACVVAHERMDFYAYLSIFEGAAKLGICFMLSYTTHDKLIVYGFLILLVTICIREINYFFCRRNFKECRYKKIWDKDYFKKMTSYAGWAFFGNTSYALSQSGLNMVLNVFGGPVVNAARGIAYQASNSLWGFITNLVIVIKPHTVKTYASGNVKQAFDIAFFASKLYFYVQLVLIICISFIAKEILEIWLGQVPEYVEVFLDLVLIQFLVKSLQMPMDMLLSAEGKIKAYQIFEGIVLMLPVPVSYVLLACGLPYYSAFLSLVFFELISVSGVVLITKIVCGLPVGIYCKRVIVPCLFMSVIAASGYIMNYLFISKLTYKIGLIFLTILFVTLFAFLFCLSCEEREVLKSLIQKKG